MAVNDQTIAPVAQWTEHPASDRGAGSSNLSRGTNNAAVVQRKEHRSSTPSVGSSNLSSRAKPW